jgi:hypothetical protein
MAHARKQDPERHIALARDRSRLAQHPIPAAAVAFDPQEPRREGGERLVERLGGAGRRVGAVAAPVARRVCSAYRRPA